MIRVSAVLPALNEAENLPRVVPELVAVLERHTDAFEIIVVDDGSADATAACVAELARRFPGVRLLRHEQNQGYGAALQTGFAAARYDWIFLTDADGQFDLNDLDRFLPYVADYDLILGYRAPRRDPLARGIAGFGWNWLVRLLFGFVARDVDCAFKLFRRAVVQRCPVRSRGAMVSAELLVRARRAGFRSIELPVHHRPRRAGSPTGLRPRVVARAFRELVQFFWRNRRNQP